MMVYDGMPSFLNPLELNRRASVRLKLWKYYTRRKTNKEPEMQVRCVGVFKNGYVVQRPSGDVLFVPKNKYSLSLYLTEFTLESK